jgi:hypothetical protein
MAFVAMQSLSMPLPGSPGLYVSRRMRRTPMIKVVVFSWLYWPPAVGGA